MVDFRQLNSADPDSWRAASQEWAALAKDLGRAAADLDRGTRRPLQNGGWSGAGAAIAAMKKIKNTIGALEAAEGELTAVSMVLAGLAQATEVSQVTLREAKDQAAREGLVIGPDGSVSRNPGTGFAPAPETILSVTQEQQISKLIGEALREATQSDQKSAAELRRLAGRTGETDPERAYNLDVNDASRTELEAIAGTIPTGPPEQVAQWWNSLPPAEQQKLMLAAPAALAGVAGIPEEIKAQLRGFDGVDRTKVVQFALQNWDRPVGRTYPDDCTNFVSEALRSGGLHQKGFDIAPFAGQSDTEHTWYGGQFGSGDPISPRSHSYTLARGLHEFLTSNNSSEVPLTQARPGDVMFWKDPHEGIHHTAVVTAVVDGHVYYTQHSGGAQNADWTARQTMYNELGDPQGASVIRVRQDD
ncbi:amidase domain-containing protein [Actinomadura barringtoniae]|nr:amidase domain-containing protein [Actinomadura barringtoniae]